MFDKKKAKEWFAKNWYYVTLGITGVSIGVGYMIYLKKSYNKYAASLDKWANNIDARLIDEVKEHTKDNLIREIIMESEMGSGYTTEVCFNNGCDLLYNIKSECLGD